QDGQRIGMMYNEKADAFLRLDSMLYPGGDKLEATAQMNKAIEMLGAVREGYVKQGIDVGKLSDRFSDASAAVKTLAPFDHSVPPERILQVEQKLRELGFGSSEENAIAAFKEALDSQFHALDLTAKTRTPLAIGRPRR